MDDNESLDIKPPQAHALKKEKHKHKHKEERRRERSNRHEKERQVRDCKLQSQFIIC